MALHTPASTLRRLSGSPGRNGLLVGGALTAALLVVSGSVETAVAGAAYLVALGLACAYAVDTALQWGRWLSDVTSDSPDTPVDRIRSGRGWIRPLGPADGEGRNSAGADADDGADPVARVHERYVRGEVDEVQFERELEAALETDADGRSGRSTADATASTESDAK